MEGGTNETGAPDATEAAQSPVAIEATGASEKTEAIKVTEENVPTDVMVSKRDSETIPSPEAKEQDLESQRSNASGTVNDDQSDKDSFMFGDEEDDEKRPVKADQDSDDILLDKDKEEADKVEDLAAFGEQEEKPEKTEEKQKPVKEIAEQKEQPKETTEGETVRTEGETEPTEGETVPTEGETTHIKAETVATDEEKKGQPKPESEAMETVENVQITSQTITIKPPTDEQKSKIDIEKRSVTKLPESISKVAPKDSLYRKRSMKQKESVVQRSIAYEFGPRFDDVDFRTTPGEFVDDEDDEPLMRYYPYLGADEEESIEEASSEEEEELATIDRDEYFEKYDELEVNMGAAKIESNLIQRKLAVFFRRRKMEHVLRETEQQPYDTVQRYNKYLDYFDQVTVDSANLKKRVAEELNNLKNKREQKFKELETLFNDMQLREKEIGYGLINTKTGNPIPDKIVERLINRQRISMQQVAAMRLKYIVLKGMVANKHDAIANIDNVGEGLRLRDYEQLKVENRSHADKIEERDEELTRLRFKCQNTIQILAHIREKSSALDVDIDELKEEMRCAEHDSQLARENLNALKMERDQTRIAINKLRMESGLLAEPTLLRDMESSMKELADITTELEHLKTDNKIKAQHIRNIRKNIELTSEELTKSKSTKTVVERRRPKPQIMRGRPSIFKPTLPIDAYDHLREKKLNRTLPSRTIFKL